jgi:hypothetical protein
MNHSMNNLPPVRGVTPTLTCRASPREVAGAMARQEPENDMSVTGSGRERGEPGATEQRFGVLDAAELGFRPDADGRHNRAALQAAVDRGGAILVSRQGVYDLAGTVYLPSHTHLTFAPGTSVRKVDLGDGPFSHVLINRGARTRTWDRDIRVDGLHVVVNGMDVRTFADAFGLHGQLAFFYARDVRVTRFRCMDLGRWQYGIHVCTFEDLAIEDVWIEGMKDGVHLGRGRRFVIRDGVFRTFDDAIALNAHDYDVGNPELGWIEDGLVENCHDLEQENTTGYFCRILTGAWRDWHEGMEVQKSDTVVHGGRMYRVRAEPDGRSFRSVTPPTHEQGIATIDGIAWVMAQDQEITYTCGVRNVTVRDVWLHKPRVGFSVHFDHDRFSRSYYPGAPATGVEHFTIENCHVLHEGDQWLVRVTPPLDVLRLSRCRFGRGGVVFEAPADSPGKTSVRLSDCTFAAEGEWELLSNRQAGRRVDLRVSGSVALREDLRVRVTSLPGATVTAAGDLPGMNAER